MCGSAAVPTIRQNTSARKLRRETSRAGVVLAGERLGVAQRRARACRESARPWSTAAFAASASFG